MSERQPNEPRPGEKDDANLSQKEAEQEKEEHKEEQNDDEQDELEPMTERSDR
jgi:hypothetical protein